MLKVAIIIASTRPGRKAEAVARWVYDIASKRSDAAFEIVDIKDFNLPLLDEPVPAARGQYSQPHTKAWAAKIEQFDAFVFVTPEYNHGPSAALKNAIDFLHREWNNKAVGFVGYGGNGGARSADRDVLSRLHIERDALDLGEVGPQPRDHLVDRVTLVVRLELNGSALS